MMKKYAICFIFLSTSPAFAHVGDHAHFDWAGIIAHLVEPDHLFFAAVTIITGFLAFRAGRKVEARAIEKRVRRPEDRS
jgi:hydrogenase/urease accessory protein HupE